MEVSKLHTVEENKSTGSGFNSPIERLERHVTIPFITPAQRHTTDTDSVH